MQDEAERLLSGISMHNNIITKVGICIVEFQERGASPRRNSTIGNPSLSNRIKKITISTSRLATYGNKGFQEVRLVFIPDMNTGINARHKIVNPNRFEPTKLNFGRGEIFAVPTPKTNPDNM